MKINKNYILLSCLSFVLFMMCGCDDSDSTCRRYDPIYDDADGRPDKKPDTDLDPEDLDIDSYRYELPLHVHVIETAVSLPVSEGRLESIIGSVNDLYRENGMNLRFTLDRVSYTLCNRTAISCTLLMESPKGSQWYEMMEDPNEVINVYVYPFKEKGILGISHLPLTTTDNPLEGLDEVESRTIRASQLENIYCVSVNSDYLYVGTFLYSPNDAVTTFAHELGHYLGLYHTFTEDEHGQVDDCFDSDYCMDTPTYNKEEYDRWLDTLDYREGEEYTLEYLSQRHNCAGEEFVSTNLLDYAYSMADEFSKEQCARVRHVLNYSPLIPGPKVKTGSKDTRSVEGGTVQLPPFRAIPCPQASNPERRLLNTGNGQNK